MGSFGVIFWDQKREENSITHQIYIKLVRAVKFRF